MSRYIDADALIEYIDRTIPREVGEEFWKGAMTIRHVIQIQPTADVRENVKGEWLSKIDTDTEMIECSYCGCRAIRGPYRLALGTKGFGFCPYCGADMREGGGE